MFVHASLYKHREEIQLDATEWFIALIICSTYFGHLYAHHQDPEAIMCVIAGYVSGMREAAQAASLIPDAEPAALLLTVNQQQPVYYTPYAAITRV